LIKIAERDGEVINVFLYVGGQTEKLVGGMVPMTVRALTFSKSLNVSIPLYRWFFLP